MSRNFRDDRSRSNRDRSRDRNDSDRDYRNRRPAKDFNNFSTSNRRDNRFNDNRDLPRDHRDSSSINRSTHDSSRSGQDSSPQPSNQSNQSSNTAPTSSAPTPAPKRAISNILSLARKNPTTSQALQRVPLPSTHNTLTNHSSSTSSRQRSASEERRAENLKKTYLGGPVDKDPPPVAREAHKSKYRFDWSASDDTTRNFNPDFDDIPVMSIGPLKSSASSGKGVGSIGMGGKSSIRHADMGISARDKKASVRTRVFFTSETFFYRSYIADNFASLSLVVFLSLSRLSKKHLHYNHHIGQKKLYHLCKNVIGEFFVKIITSQHVVTMYLSH
jgi:hypothetical protein